MELFYKVGFFLFGLCAVGWIAGFFTHQSLISTISVTMAMIILVIVEVAEYVRSQKLRHLIIPAVAVALCMLVF